MLTETANDGFTVIVITFEAAGLFEAQGSPEVSTHLIASPLTGA
jgi:hypothetical protein